MARYYKHSIETFQPENLFRVKVENDNKYKVVVEYYREPKDKQESRYSYYKIVRLLDNQGRQLVENYVGQYGTFEWTLFSKNDKEYFVYGSSSHICIHNLTDSRHSTFEIGSPICSVAFGPDYNKVLIQIGPFGGAPEWLLYDSSDLTKGLRRLGLTALPCDADRIRWLDDHRVFFRRDGDYSFRFLKSEDELNEDELNIHHNYLRNLSTASKSPSATFIECEADSCCFSERKIWNMNTNTIEWCNWPFQVQSNEIKLRLLYYRKAEYDRQQGDPTKRSDRSLRCQYRDHVVSLHNLRAFLKRQPLKPMSKRQQTLFQLHKDEVCRHRDGNQKFRLVDPLY